MYDVIIIGAGVSGSAIARELSRYDLQVLVLEREVDVCCGTSKANSGIVHAGHDAVPGSLMAKLNVRGNALMGTLAEDLDIPFIRNGSLVVCNNEADLPKLQELLEKGTKNQVPDLQILNQQELRELEPNIADEAVGALYAPTGGIVCPFGLNIALAENACENGVEFCFSSEVTGVEKTDNGYRIQTKKNGEDKEYEGKIVVNAAGVYADKIHNMVGEEKMKIIPRRGDYFLLDKVVGDYVKRTIFALPGEFGKGVLVSPTVHGNLLVGPTAIDIEDKEATNTTVAGLNKVRSECERTVKNVPLNKVITTFSGLRAHEEKDDFIIEEVTDGFIDCAGMASPGLSSCPAVGEMVAAMVCEKLKPQAKADFKGTRKGILRPEELEIEEWHKLTKEKPEYGNIICRCEHVTEGEIRDAIRRPLGATTVDGVKRRTRSGMGRCQGGFCLPKVMNILEEELHLDPLEVTKSGRDSYQLVGHIKEGL